MRGSNRESRSFGAGFFIFRLLVPPRLARFGVLFGLAKGAGFEIRPHRYICLAACRQLLVLVGWRALVAVLARLDRKEAKRLFGGADTCDKQVARLTKTGVCATPPPRWFPKHLLRPSLPGLDIIRSTSRYLASGLAFSTGRIEKRGLHAFLLVSRMLFYVV